MNVTNQKTRILIWSRIKKKKKITHTFTLDCEEDLQRTIFIFFIVTWPKWNTPYQIVVDNKVISKSAEFSVYFCLLLFFSLFLCNIWFQYLSSFMWCLFKDSSHFFNIQKFSTADFETFGQHLYDVYCDVKSGLIAFPGLFLLLKWDMTKK